VARRRKSPPIIKRGQVKLEPSSYKGVYIGHIVNAVQGSFNHMLAAEYHHMAPGTKTEPHRHSERVVHVMTGYGYSVIEGERIDWEPGDSIHIKQGYWHQHFVHDKEPANFLVGMPTPMLEKIVPYPRVYKGDSFSDVPETFQPEHPFGLGPQDVKPVSNELWDSALQKNQRERIAKMAEESKAARTILKWNEAKIERSFHKGDWKVGLVDRYLGFDTRLVLMAMHQMPPDCHTETHKHEEAIVYIRTGRGFSIIDGERYDWEAGDCFHIQPASWHQHWNLDKERVSQHIAILADPLLERLAFPGVEVKEDPSVSGFEPTYQPRLPWELDYTVPWPKKPREF
jgi:gentisate 1,2-dioxygenase